MSVYCPPTNPTLTTSLLRFSVLGPLTAEADGRPLPLGPLKLRAVLAILLCRANTPVSVDLLTEAVWDDEPPRTARKNLQMYVSTLRKAFAESGADDRLSLGAGGYRLRVEASELDSLLLQKLASAGRRAAADGDAERAADLLHEARSLWSGPPLPELSCSAVLRAEAGRLTARHLDLCENWADAALAAGRPGEVAEAIGELVECHPLRERLRAAQMTALHRSGRRAEAMAVYDDLRQRLSRELGLSPSPTLQSLYREIIADQGGGTRLLAVAGRRAAPTALPADTADFTGREETMATLLEEAVAGGDGTPCVLVGPVGAGKTSLAVRAAHRLSDAFPGGRILVRLRDADGTARSSAAVARELLAHTGIPAAASPGDPERAAVLWRGWLADRRVLVVLDDAPDEAAVRPLLPGGGRSSIIVTARTQLAGLAPARRVQVPPMSVPEALDLLGRLIGGNRVLCDRRAAERVVVACGLLPLAVRAAGLKLAVLRHLPLAEYAARLADPATVLDELAVGDLHVRSRVAEGWELLDGRHRAVLRRLARLPLAGRFTLEEAAAALGSDRHGARRTLELMIEAGAVCSPENEVTAYSAAYSLPYLTHLYAREAADGERVSAGF